MRRVPQAALPLTLHGLHAVQFSPVNQASRLPAICEAYGIQKHSLNCI